MVSKLFFKRILITGATGFVGANLTHRLLKNGATPHIILRKESNSWRIEEALKNLNLYHVDLEDKNGLERVIAKIKPEIIFHCACFGGYPFQCDSEKIFNVNFIGTVNLLNACLKSGFECFVNTGSSSEYGIKVHPMQESDIVEPVSDYGISKASAALFCQGLAKRENLSVVTLRLFSPFGYFEDQRRLIPDVMISCLNKKTVKISSPNAVRDFIFMEDVIDAYLKAVENSAAISGEIINISGGKQHSVKEVVKKIVDIWNEKIDIEWFSYANPRIEPVKWQGDISKAEKKIDWRPKHTLDDGLKITAAWFEKNIELYRYLQL